VEEQKPQHILLPSIWSTMLYLLGYYETYKAYRVYISRTLVVEEATQVSFDDYKPDKKLAEQEDTLIFNMQELKNNLPKMDDESESPE